MDSMKIAFDEDDRIEHINGFSHCRCRNKLLQSGNFSCEKFKMAKIFDNSRKKNLPDHQKCSLSSDQGYCKLSRIDEIDLIKKTGHEKLDLIVDRITTQKGLNFFEKYSRFLICS